MRLLLALIVTLFCLPMELLAQADKAINTATINQTLVHNLFLKYLNHHRDSLKLKTLTVDNHLNDAAQCQAQYIANSNKLTHTQPTKTKADVMARVNLYNGNFATVGENVLYVPLNINFVNKGITYNISNYNSLAWAMFISWRNSPEHYKNMINPYFVTSGFSVVYNPKSKLMYAAQVFGGKEYVAPYKFPRSYNVGKIEFDNLHKYEGL
jgi:uncharacterized protein YkwD